MSGKGRFGTTQVTPVKKIKVLDIQGGFSPKSARDWKEEQKRFT